MLLIRALTDPVFDISFLTKATHDVTFPTAQPIFESFDLVPRAFIDFACTSHYRDDGGEEHIGLICHVPIPEIE